MEGMKGTYEDVYAVHCYECAADLDASLPQIKQGIAPSLCLQLPYFPLTLFLSHLHVPLSFSF